MKALETLRLSYSFCIVSLWYGVTQDHSDSSTSRVAECRGFVGQNDPGRRVAPKVGCGAPKIGDRNRPLAKLVYNSNQLGKWYICMIYVWYIYINKYLRGVTNQLRTGGAPHCGNIFDDPPAISKLSLWLSGEISRDQIFEKKRIQEFHVSLPQPCLLRQVCLLQNWPFLKCADPPPDYQVL